MKRILMILMLAGALLDTKAMASSGFLCHESGLAKSDTILVFKRKEGDKVLYRKMSNSVYPVQMHVVGSAVRVESPDNQILPIYTHSGAFYLIMRLNKGTNWLNGLPKGKYFINNRLITIK